MLQNMNYPTDRDRQSALHTSPARSRTPQAMLERSQRKPLKSSIRKTAQNGECQEQDENSAGDTDAKRQNSDI